MGLPELAESLLHEEEGPTLDFKQQQYLFDGASDAEKGELLKDILAFANAWRRTDAYILIGAKEVKGGRSQILGVAQHIDDAKLQQFVNSKTNRPVDFSYRAFEMEGKQVALIHVPVQQRPTYLKKDYGPLLREVVYVRRGSSTAIANPDEISKMGAVASVELKAAPSLSAGLVSGSHDETVGTSMKLAVLNVQIPDESEFPLYGNETEVGGGLRVRMRMPTTNENFYSEYAAWWQKTRKFKPLKLRVENNGQAIATDVRVVLEIKAIGDDTEICTLKDLPKKPSPSTIDVSDLIARSVFDKPDVRVQETQDGWRVIAHFGKIQAMDKRVTSDSLLIGATKNAKIEMSGHIFADELGTPVPQNLSVEMEVTERSYSVDDFLEQLHGRI